MQDLIWTVPRPLPGLPKTLPTTSWSPRLIAFKDRLYAFHEAAGESGRLVYNWRPIDGTDWSPNVVFHGPNNSYVGTSGPPSVIEFRDRLFVFHEGQGQSRVMWYSVFDGESWLDDATVVPRGANYMGTRGAPGLVKLDFYLWIVHAGQQELSLWNCYYDGTFGPDQLIGTNKCRDTPTAFLDGNERAFACRSGQVLDDNCLITERYDFASREWIRNRAQCEMVTGGPQAVTFRGKLLLFYPSYFGSRQVLHLVSSKGNGEWSEETECRDVTKEPLRPRDTPGVWVDAANDRLHLVYESDAGDGILWETHTTSPG